MRVPILVFEANAPIGSKKPRPAPEPPAEVKAKYPSWWQRGKNFAAAIYAHVKAGGRNVSSEVQAQRIALCESCPTKQFDTAKRGCFKCGCTLDVKTWWAEQSCPDNHWPADHGA